MSRNWVEGETIIFEPAPETHAPLADETVFKKRLDVLVLVVISHMTALVWQDHVPGIIGDSCGDERRVDD